MRNGNGVYTLPSNTWNPAVSNTDIDPTDWNATGADIATALTGSIAADGQTTTTAEIPLLQGVRVNNTGLKILDTNASNTLAIVPGSDLTVNRTLTVTTGDASRTLTMTADASIPYTVPTRQVLTSGSGATYTTPAGVRQLRIRMVGGAGAGSRINGSAAAAVNGGFSSFDNAGTNYKANGGSGATSASGGGVGGAGGTGGTGGTSPNTRRFVGQAGSPGAALRPGSGGSSMLGGGAVESAAGAANSGGGGGGEQGDSAGAGGGGGEGVEIIINSPSGTYTYTIGAGATALGSAGSGGSGVIIVDEFY